MNPGYAVARVVRASRILAPGDKLLWLELHAFAGYPDGCYLTAAQLGERLGMAAETVEKARRRLLSDALVRAEGAGLGRRSRWWTTPPADATPATARPSPAEIARCVAALDRHLAALRQSASACGLHGAGESAPGDGFNPHPRADWDTDIDGKKKLPTPLLPPEEGAPHSALRPGERASASPPALGGAADRATAESGATARPEGDAPLASDVADAMRQLEDQLEVPTLRRMIAAARARRDAPTVEKLRAVLLRRTAEATA